jgi:hypothetical protein
VAGIGNGVYQSLASVLGLADIGSGSGGDAPTATAGAPALLSGPVDFVPVPWAWRPGILAPDGVHPNEGGYELWADHIAEHVAASLLLPPTADATVSATSATTAQAAAARM